MTSDEKKAAIRRRDEIDGEIQELYRQLAELQREWNELTRALDRDLNANHQDTRNLR